MLYKRLNLFEVFEWVEKCEIVMINFFFLTIEVETIIDCINSIYEHVQRCR